MNRIGILIGALAVVLIVAWLSGVFDSEYSTVDVPEWTFDRERVDGISLQTPSDTVTFSLGGTWRITQPFDAEPDSVRLGSFLGDLEGMRFGSVVSTSKDRHGRYGVDSLASSIVIRDGDNLQTLVVGNTGADYRTVYVRQAGDERVFSTEGRISVDADVDNWRDRTIIAVPLEAVVRVQVDRIDSPFGLALAAAGWTISEDGSSAAADSAAVDRWVRRFSPLKGNRFSDADAFEGAEPVAVLTFHTVGGSSQSVELREADAQLLARRPGTTDVLTLSSGLKSALVPDAGTLRSN
jgi:hypothetical protein